MASTIAAASAISTPAAFASASPKTTTSSTSTKPFVGLKPASALFGASTIASEFASKTVKNGSRVHCMQTLNPYTNDKYETLSYLPPLSDDAIAKQIDYIIKSGWIPCLEFDNVGVISREHNSSPGYYDGRYWVMWKLPMFGCQDSAQVLREIAEVKKEYPEAFVRIIGFDNLRQIDVIIREHNIRLGYYDGHYWVMCKLPLFGCQDSAQVFREIAETKKEYPEAFVRIIGFDNIRQVQCVVLFVSRGTTFFAWQPKDIQYLEPKSI